MVKHVFPVVVGKRKLPQKNKATDSFIGKVLLTQASRCMRAGIVTPKASPPPFIFLFPPPFPPRPNRLLVPVSWARH